MKRNNDWMREFDQKNHKATSIENEFGYFDYSVQRRKK
jgi:hypothetical protein